MLIRWSTSFTLCLFVCILSLLPKTLSAAEATQQNQLKDFEKKTGWRLLFDGETTDGWRNYKKDTISDGWKVENGELSRAAGGAGDIITKEQFENFELSLEYKISKGGNSGLMFHVTEEEERPWQTGPEIQIQDNVDGHDAQNAGWVYQLYSSDLDATKPAGEWNQLQVRISSDGCEINMNGIRYARFEKGSKDWDRRVAKSKFAKHEKFGKATKGHVCLQDHGNPVSFRNIKVREITPGAESPEPIDGTLALKTVLAFPDLKWTGWSPVDDDGRPQPFRPIYLTNAGDGSNRLFVIDQRGVIHTFENRPEVKETKVFLDIRAMTTYIDREFEEGLLGLAFHPNYKKNGEFFICYTDPPHQSVISRMRVSKDDPNKADPTSEEELLRIKQPFWNHNGGTLCFGPDGKLYIGLGDGGSANDPHGNGQNLETLLGSILRIDVDHKDKGKNYAIPRDNPFVGKDGAQGEIWAYGIRNSWRMSFDRETGALWEGEVGQNLWEEINLIVRGGNYGWNLREASKAFGSQGSGPRADLIDPIWEYDHEVGKSITGGVVYRGKALPNLVGCYIYGDFVTGKLWALKYDEAAKKVISNHAIPGPKLQVTSFGEDEQGEVYFTIVSPTGKGLFRFEPTTSE